MIRTDRVMAPLDNSSSKQRRQGGHRSESFASRSRRLGGGRLRGRGANSSGAKSSGPKSSAASCAAAASAPVDPGLSYSSIMYRFLDTCVIHSSMYESTSIQGLVRDVGQELVQ